MSFRWVRIVFGSSVYVFTGGSRTPRPAERISSTHSVAPQGATTSVKCLFEISPPTDRSQTEARCVARQSAAKLPCVNPCDAWGVPLMLKLRRGPAEAYAFHPRAPTYAHAWTYSCSTRTHIRAHMRICICRYNDINMYRTNTLTCICIRMS